MNTTRKKIYQYIKKVGKTTPFEISENFLIGKAMTHRHLKKLLEDDLIQKEGSAPKVFYSLKENLNEKENKKVHFSKKEKEILEENFLYITPTGKRISGEKAFVFWCKERNFHPNQKIKEYIEILNKYKKIKKNNFYDATSKLEISFKKVCAEKLFYSDFNSIEIFGKTKLGQMVLYAKQSQDRKEMKKIVDLIKKDIQNLVKKEKIDSVIFVPPTVKREYQFMNFLERNLELNLPKIKVIKKINDIAVPQKTLKKLAHRQANARETFEVVDTVKYKNTLIIDDAVGSGSTINEIACKLKQKELTKKVTGLSVVGSLNGFEIISEV